MSLQIESAQHKDSANHKPRRSYQNQETEKSLKKSKEEEGKTRARTLRKL